MSEVVLHPVAAGDDSYSDSSLYSTGGIQIGCISTSPRTAYFRFPSASIDSQSAISSAILSVQAYAIDSISLTVRIFGNDVDNAIAPLNKTQGDALGRTTAYVDWAVPSFTTGNDYTVDIKDVVQEVIDRAGWSSGNALQIIIESLVTTSTAYRQIKDVAAVPATLTITYSPVVTYSVPAAGIVITRNAPIFSPYYIEIPAAGLVVAGHGALPWVEFDVPCLPGLLLGAPAPKYGYVLLLPVAGIEVEDLNPSYVWAINARFLPAAQTIYTLTLTGDGESPALEDITLPMSSFQGRMRDGSPSYLACYIPNATAYADAIAARTNGDIVIQKGYRYQDGTTQLEEIARVDFESMRIDQGSGSASVTLVGHRTTSATTSKIVTVQGVSYYCLQEDGKRRIRATLDLFLRVGDICVYGTGGGDYMVVGYLSYTVSTELIIMEVTEA